ncbi:FYVE-type domain-containing protein [Aphelenchoides besseyi]|nr:FYVE-type domain-containing protein [Aphelenchoides besseyi]KAI6211602.1 FYVE-type domain-containing protein [Aphelenchoides besseyi]
MALLPDMDSLLDGLEEKIKEDQKIQQPKSTLRPSISPSDHLEVKADVVDSEASYQSNGVAEVPVDPEWPIVNLAEDSFISEPLPAPVSETATTHGEAEFEATNREDVEVSIAVVESEKIDLRIECPETTNEVEAPVESTQIESTDPPVDPTVTEETNQEPGDEIEMNKESDTIRESPLIEDQEIEGESSKPESATETNEPEVAQNYVLDHTATEFLLAEADRILAEAARESETNEEEVEGPIEQPEYLVEEPTEQPEEQPAEQSEEQAEDVKQKRSVILSTHAVGNVGTDLRLTESELQLGKTKPIWIKDEDCKKCMLCTSKFTIVNRRHHCRCCGRVLCADCCAIRRQLPYMQVDEKRQRVCAPCNSTLDRIELYEKTMQTADSDNQPANDQLNAESSVSSQQTAVNSTTATASSSGFFQRKKSVLKRSKTEPEESRDQTHPSTSTEIVETRRSVKFLDGIAPGDDSGTTIVSSAPTTGILSARRSSARSSKPNRSSRRSREVLCEEECRNLQARWFYRLVDPLTDELVPWNQDELFERVASQRPVRLVLRRNLSVQFQFIELQGRKVYSIYTIGFNALGVCELVLVLEKRPEDPETSIPSALIRSFTRYADNCLRPTTNSLDDRNGIRQCAERMASIHMLEETETEGHDAVAILWHSYQNQNMSQIPHPLHIFRIGTFVRRSELPYVQSMPSRFLYRLGQLSSTYPMPVINRIDREPAFAPFNDINELINATILTMFHDFRHATYQLPHVSGSYALITDRQTRICLPTWAHQQVKEIVNSNTNLLAWGMDLSYQADSVLTVERVSNSFATRVFQRATTRESIGAAFAAFSTGHKGNENSYTQTLVEDGVVIRLSSDQLELFAKRLTAGEDFHMRTEKGNELDVTWIEDHILTSNGSLQSPIDGMDLRGFYQYGLLLNRASYANHPFVTMRNKALRLGAVISLNHQRMDPQIQSQFFDACEQLTNILRSGLEHFVQMLLSLDINQICVRIFAGNDRVGYELAPWIGLEDAYDSYLKILGETMLPQLYQLTARASVDFRVELHLPIISIRALDQMESSERENVQPTESGDQTSAVESTS